MWKRRLRRCGAGPRTRTRNSVRRRRRADPSRTTACRRKYSIRSRSRRSKEIRSRSPIANGEPVDTSRIYDVLILGGGNAALCAAITARRAGRSVLLLECAPKHFRGGNSRHTRNLRCMHDGPADVLTGAYPEEEYWHDLLQVTGGETDERLARITIRHTATCRDWMVRHGVRFQPSLGGTLHVARTNAFFLGGRRAMVKTNYRAAEAIGVEISYDTEVVDLALRGGRFESATVVRYGLEQTIRAKTVVAASGGFEANLAWLKEAWG